MTMIRPPTGVLITGEDEDEISRAAESWPRTIDTDACRTSPAAPRDGAFTRALGRIVEHARLKLEAADLRRSIGLQEVKVKDVLGEISEIKGLLNSGFLREVEKRLAIEARYIGSQKERQRFESILLRIYGADDVNSLLDIVPEIRDTVHASSVSVYIMEENDVIGRYLKPLVWDNAFLTHSDFSKYIATLEAQDFAASVARYGHDIAVANLTFDRRLSKRYTSLLKAAPRSLLGVPIMHGPKVIGVLEVTNKTAAGQPVPEGFSREDQQILRGLSDHMAIAMAKLNLIQYDPLTGLLRPEPFFEKVLQKINGLSKRRREEGAMALVMGDVDWFKAYNDRNGQEAGNRLLRELGHVLKLAIREEDLICRYGGEEFLFFLMGVKGVEEASLLTDRIRKSVEDHYFELQEFQPRGNLTMSFGVTVFPKNFSEQPALMTRSELKRLAGEADLALAEAKGKARPDLKPRGPGDVPVDKNRVCSFVGQEAGADGEGRGRGPERAGPPREKEVRALHGLDALPLPRQRRVQGRQDGQHQPGGGAHRVRRPARRGPVARYDPGHRGQGHPRQVLARLCGTGRRRSGLLLHGGEVRGPDLQGDQGTRELPPALPQAGHAPLMPRRTPSGRGLISFDLPLERPEVGPPRLDPGQEGPADPRPRRRRSR